MAAGRLAVPGVDTAPLVPAPRFRFERSWFDSFVAYERDLIEAVRRVQYERWLLRFEARERRVEVDRRADVLRHLQECLDRELYRVRAAVDAERAEGRGRACVVDALRSEPNRPSGVREYPDVRAFVAEDARRALPDWPHRLDAGGEDHGFHWGLENPLCRWETTRWRISWLCMDDPTHELYAIELVRRDAEPRAGRVWLLGTITSRATVAEALAELELHAQRERNSLVAAAAAVRRVVISPP